MTAVVVQLRQRASRSQTWSNQELAEFYRVTEILSQSGIAVGLDSGVTDEGDPWQVFYREDTGDILVHFARIDGQFVIACPPTGEVQRGTDMRDMIVSMIGRQPSFKPLVSKAKGNVHLHPAMVLCTFVVIVYLLAVDASEARAAEPASAGSAAPDQPPPPAEAHALEGAPAGAVPPAGARSAPAGAARKAEASSMEARYTSVMATVVAALLLDAPHAEETATPLLVERPMKDTATSAAMLFTQAAQDASLHDDGRAHSLHAGQILRLDQDTAVPKTPEIIQVSTDARGPGQPQPDHPPILLSASPPMVSRDGVGTGFALLGEHGPSVDGHGSQEPHVPAPLTLTVPSAPVTVKIPAGDAVLVIALERITAQPALNVQNAVEVHFQIIAPAANGHDVIPARLDGVEAGGTPPSAPPDAGAVPHGNAASPGAAAPEDAKPVLHASAPGPAQDLPVKRPDAAPTVFNVDQPNTKTVLLKGADVVVYSGGNVTLYNFEMGVDKLIINADKIDTSHMVARWSSSDELVIDFGGGMFVKMVGIVTEHAAS